MKKILGLGIILSVITASLSGCVTDSGNQNSSTDKTKTASISLVSREDGSGTRGAFVELFSIEEKDADGNKIDRTSDLAEITNSTSVMMTTVAGNKNAIGYISLCSLNETVKAVNIDGASANIENIKNGTYRIARPFNIAAKDKENKNVTDFISFIMSEQGQKVIEDRGYISQGNQGPYTATGISGKITIAGSSSVAPVMEAIKEAYVLLNPNAEIEIQQSDSTTGMTSVAEGVCDIGMASREIKESELEKGLIPTVIAMDGIAVIVNNENPVNSLTSEQVKSIFTGYASDWSEITQ